MSASVGVIGVGNMGGRIARRLVAAGLTVHGFDVDHQQVSAAGASVSTSVPELVKACEQVLFSLPDSDAVESVVYRAGLLDALRPGQCVVDLSTSHPGSSRRIHDAIADRGAHYIDAGISGGAAAAEKGTLTIMAGGDGEVIDSLREMFGHFATQVVHMGASGSGHVTKILNNFLNAVSLAATSEVMVAGRKAGLDLERLLEVLNTSSGVNFATLNRFPKIIHGDYLEGGLSSALMTKDITLYVAYLGDLGVPSLNASGPLATFGLANHLGYQDLISNRVVDAVGDIAGQVRLDDKHATEKSRNS